VSGRDKWNERSDARVPSWEDQQEASQMLSNPIGKDMSKAQDSAKSTEEIARDAAKVDVDLRTLQQSQKTLDENEEWIARNSGKLISK
jgi:hypothetical protein